MSKTWIILLIDASGSMDTLQREVSSGYVNFVNAQKSLPTPCELSVYTFNDRPKHIFINRDIHTKNTEIVYSTTGGTAIYDTLLKASSDIFAKNLALSPEERPTEVIFILVTDGAENRSHSSLSETHTCITSLEKDYGWHFLFVGSNQNAYATGSKMGIKAGKALSFAASANGLEAAFGAMAQSVLKYRQSGAPHANQFFSETDHSFQASLGASRSPLKS